MASSRALLGLAALLLACSYVGPGSATTLAGARILWVAPNGSDANACSPVAPCRTFDRAYHVANPGDSVRIAGGLYPAQSITPDVTKANAAADVVFQPAAAPVTIGGGLVIRGYHLAVVGVTTPTWSVAPGADHVTMRNVNATGAIFITGATNVSVVGGSAGRAPGVYSTNGSQIKAASGSTVAPRNILVDGVSFHDFLRQPGTSNHVDCLHVMSGDGITIRNSHFTNCEAFAILFTVLGAAGSPRNVVVDHNVLDCCVSGYYSLSLGGGHGEVFTNFLVSNNISADRGMTVGTRNVLQNVRFVNNRGSIAGCGRLPAGSCTTDTSPPHLLNMPPQRLAEASSSAGAVIAWPAPSASDNLDPNPVVSCSPPSGATFPLGTTTVTCTAADASGNMSSASFSVTVRDTTPPSRPTTSTVANATRAGYSLSWTPSSDAVGVAGYDVFLDGDRVSTTTATWFAFGGLACGTSHTLGVTAHDAAGNVSAVLNTIAATLPCARERAPGG